MSGELYAVLTMQYMTVYNKKMQALPSTSHVSLFGNQRDVWCTTPNAQNTVNGAKWASTTECKSLRCRVN